MPTRGNLNCFNANVPGDRRFVYVVKNPDTDPAFYVGLDVEVSIGAYGDSWWTQNG